MVVDSFILLDPLHSSELLCQDKLKEAIEPLDTQHPFSLTVILSDPMTSSSPDHQQHQFWMTPLLSVNISAVMIKQALLNKHLVQEII
jgi:hypothetical protein